MLDNLIHFKIRCPDFKTNSYIDLMLHETELPMKLLKLFIMYFN